MLYICIGVKHIKAAEICVGVKLLFIIIGVKYLYRCIGVKHLKNVYVFDTTNY